MINIPMININSEDITILTEAFNSINKIMINIANPPLI